MFESQHLISGHGGKTISQRKVAYSFIHAVLSLVLECYKLLIGPRGWWLQAETMRWKFHKPLLVLT